MSEPILEVTDLRRLFDVSKPWLERVISREPRQLLTAVDEVSFSIKKGETFALVGKSGSGKSTVAKMVVCLLGPSGHGALCGRAGRGSAPAPHGADDLSRIPMPRSIPLARGGYHRRADDRDRHPNDSASRTARVVQNSSRWWSFPADGDKYPHQFSGVSASASRLRARFSSEPEFIVCDEPTSALDVSVQAQILNPHA